MTMAKRTSHTEEVLSLLSHPREAERFTRAHAFLKLHLVHTRDVLNGKDFLFSGPHKELHEALRTLVEVEHRCSRFLQIDAVEIEDYFLLRVVGSEKCREVIKSYFG